MRHVSLILAACLMVPSLSAQYPLRFKLFELPEGTTSIQGSADPAVPFVAYSLTVNPGETLTATLEHENKGEIFLVIYGPLEWKHTESGHRPHRRVITQSMSWTNKGKEAAKATVLIDDPQKRSTIGVPFTIRFEKKQKS